MDGPEKENNNNTNKPREIDSDGMLGTCRRAFTLAKLIYCLAIPACRCFVRDRISDVHVCATFSALHYSVFLVVHVGHVCNELFGKSLGVPPPSSARKNITKHGFIRGNACFMATRKVFQKFRPVAIEIFIRPNRFERTPIVKSWIVLIWTELSQTRDRISLAQWLRKGPRTERTFASKKPTATRSPSEFN